MGVFSGSSIKDPNGLTLVDFLAGSVSDEAVRRILRGVALPKIGELRFNANTAHAAQGDIQSSEDIPAWFNGWLYANGSKIYSDMFPAAVEFFKSTDYAGKTSGDDWVTIPSVTRFFRINAGGKAAYHEEACRYALPDHTHKLGSPIAPGITQTVRRCTYIWSTSAAKNPADGGGWIPDIVENFKYEKKDDEVLIKKIMPSPSAHRGAAGSDENIAQCRCDIPIDTTYMEGEIEFKCTTGTAGDSTAQCWPGHVTVPLMVYIGMYTGR